MSYTREIRKKLSKIEAKEVEIEALENDVRMAAFNHIVSIVEGDIFNLDAPHYINLHRWSDVTISLKSGKEKRLLACFLRVFLDDKNPVLIAGKQEIDIFKIKKIEVC